MEGKTNETNENMSIKQCFALFCLYLVYLNLGAVYFYYKESRAEDDRHLVKLQEKREIIDMLHQHYVPKDTDNQYQILHKLSDYCGKNMLNYTEPKETKQWDYFHSLFFVVTVCTTIGYGNLAPTIMSTRIFMIFYAVIGIGINGMLFASVADHFGKSFLRLYDRWKSHKKQYQTARLDVLGQIILYLILGFMFFIFFPAVVISFFEKWDYDVAVYYAFVTLSTIGFGDIVAGVNDNGFSETTFWTYKIFLLVWIIAGLGYLVMVIGFVISGFRSKTIHQLEHKLAMNLKKSPQKLRRELRALLNEFLLLKVKRVYRENFVITPLKRERSLSCPDLTYSRRSGNVVAARKRAKSEADNSDTGELMRIQSDTDLGHIDKELTFKSSAALVQPCEILARFVNALGNCETMEETSESELEGFDGFTDSQILASEAYSSGWTIGSHKLSAIPHRFHRQRAVSEVKFPIGDSQEEVSEWTWSGPSATQQLQECRERIKRGKMMRSKTLPPLSVSVIPYPPPSTFQPPSQPNGMSLITRIKHTFRKPSKTDDKSKLKQSIDRDDYTNKTSRRGSNYSDDHNVRTRRSSMFSVHGDNLLERTSLADFIRALTAITVPEATKTAPCRKMGTASLTPPNSMKATPQRSRRHPIRPPFQHRKPSLTTTPSNAGRRLSLRGVPTITEATDGFVPPPPPYSVTPQDEKRPRRTFSLRPVHMSLTPSPVQRHQRVVKAEDDPSDSLTDVCVEKL